MFCTELIDLVSDMEVSNDIPALLRMPAQPRAPWPERVAPALFGRGRAERLGKGSWALACGAFPLGLYGFLAWFAFR